MSALGDVGFVGTAERRHRFNESLQHGLQVERRPADDLEHIRGGSLLLQRLTQLVEQPRVLDRCAMSVLQDARASSLCRGIR